MSGQVGKQVNTVLVFSHDHINITTKLQDNKPGEPSEDELNRSPITQNIKKKPS